MLQVNAFSPVLPHPVPNVLSHMLQVKGFSPVLLQPERHNGLSYLLQVKGQPNALSHMLLVKGFSLVLLHVL